MFQYAMGWGTLDAMGWGTLDVPICYGVGHIGCYGVGHIGCSNMLWGGAHWMFHTHVVIKGLLSFNFHLNLILLRQ